MKASILFLVGITALAACSKIAYVVGYAVQCPTLWLQVEKSDPSPWPEVSDQSALAPQTPVDMQNRFDVLAHGVRTIFAPEYSDRLDPRDDVTTGLTRALTGLEKIVSKYGGTKLAPVGCATTTGKVLCDIPGGKGKAGGCNLLLVPALSSPDVSTISIGDEYFVVRSVDPPDDEDSNFGLNLTQAVDLDDNTEVEICVNPELEFSRTLLSFVHLSDIQLRDPSVVLTDRAVSKRLDWFTALHSFEYDEDLMFYNQYLAEAMVATINAGVVTKTDPNEPSFAIHTGDSIDSNAKSELARFHKVIDRLHIPFYEVFGNHDVLVFGNLTPTAIPDNDDTCTPVSALIGAESSFVPDKLCVEEKMQRCPTCSAEEAEFIASSKGQAETRRRFMEMLDHSKKTDPLAQMPAPPPTDERGGYCNDPFVPADAYTRAHGFDLNTRNNVPGDSASDYLGYYAFVQRMTDEPRNVVFIVLDTEDLEDGKGGITGRVGTDQLTWLRGVLHCVQTKHKNDIVLVFGHQPLSLIAVPTEVATHEKMSANQVLATTLEGSTNVVGYLYGHDHEHKICGDSNRKGSCAHFWEIETGSLVEFPQEARMIRIKQISSSLAFLEVSTFSERIASRESDLARFVDLARRGAERDHCVTHNARCSDDKRPYRTDGHHTAGRLFFKLP